MACSTAVLCASAIIVPVCERRSARLLQGAELVMVGEIAPVEVLAGIPKQFQENAVQKANQKTELFEYRCVWRDLGTVFVGGALAVELAGVHQVVPAHDEQLDLARGDHQ